MAILGLAAAAEHGLLGPWAGGLLVPSRAMIALRAVAALAFLLGWRLRSGRAARAALILWLVAELVSSSAATGTRVAVRAALAVLLPLDLAAVAWLREASLLSRPGILRLAFTPLVALLLTSPVLTRLGAWGFDPAAEPRWIGASVVLAAGVLLVRLASRPQPLEAAWLGLVGAYAGVFIFGGGLVFLLAGGAVLAFALVEGAFALAFVDRLTALPGRAALDQRLGEIGDRYAIAMVDIDHFKRVNDRHGHDVGDEVLRAVAAQLRAVGGGGVAYRYGGEEFAIVFAGRTVAEVKADLEVLRVSIAERPFVLRAPTRKTSSAKGRGADSQKKSKGRTLGVSVSIGVAARGPRTATSAAVLKAADKALYRAKRTGRNRVAVTRG